MQTSNSIEELLRQVDEVPDITDLQRNYVKERVRINALVEEAQVFVNHITDSAACLNELLPLIHEKGQILDALLAQSEAVTEH